MPYQLGNFEKFELEEQPITFQRGRVSPDSIYILYTHFGWTGLIFSPSTETLKQFYICQIDMQMLSDLVISRVNGSRVRKD